LLIEHAERDEDRAGRDLKRARIDPAELVGLGGALRA
jgi:hypothetical protein